MDFSRQRSIRAAVFLMAACALATPLDPTGAVPSGYHVIRLGENAIRNLMLLYDGVIQALATIELPPWIDECTCAILHGDLTLLLHLPAVFVILRLVLKILSEIVAGAPPSTQQEEVDPHRRYLTAFTDTEEDARLMLRRRSRYSNGRKQRDAELYNRKSPPGHKTADDEVVAATVIQRWVRTKFQPWMAVRRILRSPDLAANCTDRDAGAVEVTLVDHDFMSAIEQLSEHPLVEVEMNGTGMAPRRSPTRPRRRWYQFPRLSQTPRGSDDVIYSHFPKKEPQ
ncbi:hypothetical protein MRX96_002384 [Rhipicephalus microplus]